MELYATINMFPRFIKSRTENGFLIKVVSSWLIVLLFFGKGRSPRTFRSAPSTALRVLARDDPCLRRVLLYCTLLKVLGEVLVAIRVSGIE